MAVRHLLRASHDDYDESAIPTCLPIGTCQDALDSACGLYLNDPTVLDLTPDELAGMTTKAWDEAHAEQAARQASPHD